MNRFQPLILMSFLVPVPCWGGVIVFSDNFDSEPVVGFENGYTGFQNWHVTKGSVDIIQNDPTFWPAPSSGGWELSDGFLLDMAGFDAGAIETKTAF